ncbi:hypothetical protein AVEN_168771-1 [Araneus ventricosus]|uniref:Uncharacterized protein n=1 Tax=Araneus ventricosus TaxID=182803 RepID=A0A4Y2GF80_ARAVE|nr:hypothetical protein AVEN_168771-1 [Araneus ventricosus]
MMEPLPIRGGKQVLFSKLKNKLKDHYSGVCLLHFNELPFRHLFINLDGETTVSKSVSGPIGTQLSKYEKLPVVNFKSNECEISEIERKILSKDQQYLLDISYAVKSGSSPEDLFVSEPGPLSHSRWLTTANRVLRLYLSIKNTTDEHKILVSFNPKSYMPVWFHIKKSKYFTNGLEHVFEVIKSSFTNGPEHVFEAIKSSFTNGPEHVFEVIKSSRFLPENLLSH